MTTNKDDATRVALAALSGHQLRKLADGTWLVSRWNLQRELADDDAVDDFLRAVRSTSSGHQADTGANRPGRDGQRA